MDLLVFILPLCIFVAMVAFSFGQYTKDYPTEDEMMRRIVAGRVKARIEREVESAIAEEISRQAAR